MLADVIKGTEDRGKNREEDKDTPQQGVTSYNTSRPLASYRDSPRYTYPDVAGPRTALLWMLLPWYHDIATND
jgi:hypothetical protein